MRRDRKRKMRRNMRGSREYHDGKINIKWQVEIRHALITWSSEMKMNHTRIHREMESVTQGDEQRKAERE